MKLEPLNGVHPVNTFKIKEKVAGKDAPLLFFLFI